MLPQLIVLALLPVFTPMYLQQDGVPNDKAFDKCMKDATKVPMPTYQKALRRCECTYGFSMDCLDVPKPATPPPGKPGYKGKCDKDDYVVLPDSVNVGGKVAWRNNDPGGLTCMPGNPYGSYGCTGFAVFPDYASGRRALTQWVKDHGSETILQFANAHAPRNDPAHPTMYNAGNNPDAYANAMVQALQSAGPDASYSGATRLGSLSDAEIETLVKAIINQEGSQQPQNQGKTYKLDDPSSMPASLRACLGLDVKSS